MNIITRGEQPLPPEVELQDLIAQTDEFYSRLARLSPLALWKPSFTRLSKMDAAISVTSLLDSGALNSLGIEAYTFVQDRLILSTDQIVEISPNLVSAATTIATLRQRGTQKFAYITGGLEVAQHHLQIVDALQLEGHIPIIGIETPSYINQKGKRNALFTLSEKMSLWAHLAPESSILFVVPPMPNKLNRPKNKPLTPDEYYTWITKVLGIYQKEDVFYVCDPLNTNEIVQSIQSRAYSPDHIRYITWGTMHKSTSDLVNTSD